MRLLITGSRHATWDGHAAEIRHRMDMAYWMLSQGFNGDWSREHFTVVDGECVHGGVDQIAHQIALEAGWDTERHAASWHADALTRNIHMVRQGADLCLAFPARTSRGTWHCLTHAGKAGIPTWIYPLNT